MQGTGNLQLSPSDLESQQIQFKSNVACFCLILGWGGNNHKNLYLYLSLCAALYDRELRKAYFQDH